MKIETIEIISVQSSFTPAYQISDIISQTQLENQISNLKTGLSALRINLKSQNESYKTIESQISNRANIESQVKISITRMTVRFLDPLGRGGNLSN